MLKHNLNHHILPDDLIIALVPTRKNLGIKGVVVLGIGSSVLEKVKKHKQEGSTGKASLVVGRVGAAPPHLMNFLCLNFRGCGRFLAVQELHHLVETHRQSSFFLSKTKMKAMRVDNPKWSICFDNSLGIDNEGLSGGLAMFWNNEFLCG